jgi:two-component system cell cycle sensor histidine kinase/response regulator CckA
VEAVGQLAGGIAHDFNNLLTAIIGNSALALTNAAAEDPNYPLISDIHEVAEQAAALTEQILAFSRRQMLTPQVLCLNRVILDMESLLRRTLGEDVDLSLSLAPDLWDSEIDAHQISQVVLNLAVNARDAMPESGRLLIQTANVKLDGVKRHMQGDPKRGEYVMLAVVDSGHGMDKETLDRAFEPFFTTKGVGSGTRLGLSTVFGIVDQSGGSISVSSEPGRGSAFKVYLPVAQRTEPVVNRPSPQRISLAADGMKVLVVEDEAPVRGLVARVLATAGY